ncbi:MAG: membrane-bound lytic murein transglycosylase MltF [Pseudomonadota bacterium]
MRPAFALIAAAILTTCSPAPTRLEHVLANGRLDVLTRNSPTSYYSGPGGPTGPEFDLMRGFAEHLGVRLNVLVEQRFDNIVPRIAAGQAHIAAAGLSVTRARRELVDFAEPFQQVTQHLVYKLGTGRPRGIDDVLGRDIVVVAGSAHAETLHGIKVDRPRLTWREDTEADVADLLSDVASGAIEYTVADSTDFNINRNFLPDLRVGFDLEVADSIAWAFPPQHSETLIAAANEYLLTIRRNGRLARVLDRYYGHTDEFDYVGTRAFIRHFDSRLPRYESWFREAAEQNGLDWRLLAAIGYQESHWRPGAVSPTGVRGIMMLTAATADVLGVEDREDPRQSIFGAARYFARLKERLPNTIREPDLTWMALAAYNVGFYHLRDARALVELDGGNPNAWIEVRQALPKLAQKKYYERVKYGYARGWEPVQYVENIRSYLDILRWMTSDPAPGDSEPDVLALSEPADET